MFILPVQISFKNLAVPLSAGTFIHITAVVDLVIHNTIALYTIIFPDNSSIAPIAFYADRRFSSAAAQIIGLSVNGYLAVFYIFYLSIFLNPVNPVSYADAAAAFSHCGISHVIYQITISIFYNHRIPGLPGSNLCARGSLINFTALRVIDNITQYHIAIHILSYQFFGITSRPHPEQLITKPPLSLRKALFLAFLYLRQEIYVITVSTHRIPCGLFWGSLPSQHHYLVLHCLAVQNGLKKSCVLSPQITPECIGPHKTVQVFTSAFRYIVRINLDILQISLCIMAGICLTFLFQLSGSHNTITVKIIEETLYILPLVCHIFLFIQIIHPTFICLIPSGLWLILCIYGDRRHLLFLCSEIQIFIIRPDFPNHGHDYIYGCYHNNGCHNNQKYGLNW